MGFITSLASITGVTLIASVVLGPRSLPRYARIGGRFVGRTVKGVGDMRSAFSSSQDESVVKLREELESGIFELNNIRQELRQNLSVQTRQRFDQEVSQQQPASSNPSVSKATSTSKTSKASTISSTTKMPNHPTSPSSSSTADLHSIPVNNYARVFSRPSLLHHPRAPSYTPSPLPSPVSSVSSSSASASASASSWDHLLASHARSSSPSLPFRHLDVGLQPSLFTKEAWERGAVLPTDRMTGGGDLVGESVLERVYARYMSEMSSS